MANTLYVSMRALYDHLEEHLHESLFTRVAIGDVMEIVSGTLEFLNIEEVEN